MAARSIILATPSTGMWREGMGTCAIGLAGLTARAGAIIDAVGATGAYTEQNRNNIVRAVLARSPPVDYILWIDSDMKFPPDALLGMLNRGVDIVGATYRERQEPYRFLGCFLDEDDGHAKEPGLHKMKYLPGGFILVKMDVYRKLSPPWYERDEEGVRDDYYFCALARAAGYDVWGDMDLTPYVVHRGEIDIEWFGDGEAVERRKEDPRWKIFDNRTLALGVPNRNGALEQPAQRTGS